ncbi:G-protein coupled receptor 55 [Larimichthys crocea]|uniref:Uncharacterized protein n=1 Tax=Larimichthys crocea TaxID=215358 RepID=A0ACD3QTI9_LARCR|nr:G-protein coupled receptor 55 [Larimichthys crocea]
MVHSSSICRFLLLVLLGLMVAFVHTETVADPASTTRDNQDTMSGEAPSDVTTKDPFQDMTEQAFTDDYEDTTHSQAMDEEEAVDRWVAICHPFKAKQLRSPKVALGTCVAVWLLVLAVFFPTVYRFRENEKSEFKCFHKFSSDSWRPMVIICLLVFGFLGPALVLVYCSVRTILALQQSGQNSLQSRACVKIIYSSLSAFLVPFTPSHLGILLQFLVHQKVITGLRQHGRHQPVHTGHSIHVNAMKAKPKWKVAYFPHAVTL